MCIEAFYAASPMEASKRHERGLTRADHDGVHPTGCATADKALDRLPEHRFVHPCQQIRGAV
jgi:hypothetical protein